MFSRITSKGIICSPEVRLWHVKTHVHQFLVLSVLDVKALSAHFAKGFWLCGSEWPAREKGLKQTNSCQVPRFHKESLKISTVDFLVGLDRTVARKPFLPCFSWLCPVGVESSKSRTQWQRRWMLRCSCCRLQEFQQQTEEWVGVNTFKDFRTCMAWTCVEAALCISALVHISPVLRVSLTYCHQPIRSLTPQNEIQDTAVCEIHRHWIKYSYHVTVSGCSLNT